MKNSKFIVCLVVIVLGLGVNVLQSSEATDQYKKESLKIGNHPAFIIYNPNNGFMYVTNEGSASVSVINGTNIIENISTDGFFPVRLAFSPDNQSLFVTSFQHSTILRIDLETENVSQVLNIDSPLGIAVNPSANLLYITSEESGLDSDAWISTINIRDNTVVNTSNLSKSIYPNMIMHYSKQNTFYVTDGDKQYPNTLTVFDPELNNTRQEITLSGNYSTSITSNPVEMNLYIASTEEIWTFNRTEGNTDYYDIKKTGIIDVVDSTSNKLIKSINNVGYGLSDIEYVPKNNMIYVTDEWNDSVIPVSIENNTVSSPIPVEDYPTSLKYNPSNNLLYVVNSYNTNLNNDENSTGTLTIINLK